MRKKKEIRRYSQAAVNTVILALLLAVADTISLAKVFLKMLDNKKGDKK